MVQYFAARMPTIGDFLMDATTSQRALPLVSVIVPMFNVERSVLNSLGTIQDQVYENIEVICIDDGSTDRTLEYAKSFSADPRFRIIEQENRGLGGARNTGIREARGDWLTFVDSDDWIHPRMVSDLVDKALSDNDFDIVDCLHTLLSPSGETVATRDGLIVTGDTNYFARVMSGREPAQACARLYRRTLFDQGDFFFPEKTFHEDLYTVYRLFYASRKSATVPKPLYIWLEREGSISRSSSRKHVDDVFASFDSAFIFLNKEGIRDQYIGEFYHRCAHFSWGIFQKIGKYTSGSVADDTAKYLRERLRASPFFSNKMVAYLQAKNPALLERLSRHGDFWGGAQQKKQAASGAASAPAMRPGYGGFPDNVDPHYYISFAGLLLMIYRKLRHVYRRIFQRGRWA